LCALYIYIFERADDAEERMREMRNEQLMGGNSDAEMVVQQPREEKKKESRWNSAINSMSSMRARNSAKNNPSDRRQDNHWIRNAQGANSSFNQDEDDNAATTSSSSSSSSSNYNNTRSPPTRWQSSPNLEVDRNRSASFSGGGGGGGRGGYDNDMSQDLEITVLDDGPNLNQSVDGGRRLSFGMGVPSRTTSVSLSSSTAASKLNAFVQSSPNERGSSCPRPITPEKQSKCIQIYSTFQSFNAHMFQCLISFC
jgi:hypothetical protein